MAAAIAESPEADVLYSDEDKLSPSGQRQVPTFKPDWSPDLLLSSAYLCHLLVVRRSLVEELGGLRSDFDGAQDYDLMLRATERRPRRSSTSPRFCTTGEARRLGGGRHGGQALGLRSRPPGPGSALARRGFAAVVQPHEHFPGNFHLRREIVGGPLVSIIVPFRDEPERMAACVRSLLDAPGYDRFELLFADYGSELPETRALLEQLASKPNPADRRRPAPG